MTIDRLSRAIESIEQRQQEAAESIERLEKKNGRSRFGWEFWTHLLVPSVVFVSTVYFTGKENRLLIQKLEERHGRLEQSVDRLESSIDGLRNHLLKHGR